MKKVVVLFILLAFVLAAGCTNLKVQSKVKKEECDCVYGGKVYSPGAVVKMSGVEYECVCGEWKKKQ